MAGESTTTVFDGMFKDVYAEGENAITDVRPTSSVIQRKYPFQSDEKMGDEYRADICLRLPSNRTYTGSGGGVNALVAFAAGNNGEYQQAVSKSYECVTRDRISYKVLNQASIKGKAAFQKASTTVVEAINTSASLALELSLLRGQYGLGVVESVVDNTTSADVTITADSYAEGIWWALMGSYIDSYTGTTQTATSLYLTANTPSTRTIRLTGTDLPVAGDVLFPRASYGTTPTDFAGLYAQATNTSGTMLGLSAGTYPNWAANGAVNVGGPITWRALNDALKGPRARAADMATEGFYAFAGRAYGSLSSELQEKGRMALDDAKRNIKAGVSELSFQTHRLGDIDLIFHPFISDGHILVLPKKGVIRPGASDISFNVGGMTEKYFTLVPDYTAVELQAVSDQTVMLLRPSAAVLLSGITY